MIQWTSKAKLPWTLAFIEFYWMVRTPLPTIVSNGHIQNHNTRVVWKGLLVFGCGQREYGSPVSIRIQMRWRDRMHFSLAIREVSNSFMTPTFSRKIFNRILDIGYLCLIKEHHQSMNSMWNHCCWDNCIRKWLLTYLSWPMVKFASSFYPIESSSGSAQ